MSLFKATAFINQSGWNLGQCEAMQGLIVKACLSKPTIVESDCHEGSQVCIVNYQKVKHGNNVFGIFSGMSGYKQSAIFPSYPHQTKKRDIKGCPEGEDCFDDYDTLLRGIHCILASIENLINLGWCKDKLNTQQEKVALHILYDQNSKPLIRFLQLVKNTNLPSEADKPIINTRVLVLAIKMIDNMMNGKEKLLLTDEVWRQVLTGLVAFVLSPFNLTFKNYGSVSLKVPFTYQDVERLIEGSAGSESSGSILELKSHKKADAMNKLYDLAHELLQTMEQLSKPVVSEAIMPSKFIN